MEESEKEREKRERKRERKNRGERLKKKNYFVLPFSFLINRISSPGVPGRVSKDAGVHLRRRGGVDEPIADSELLFFVRFFVFIRSEFVL